MKTRLGVLIFVFLAGMILGASQPALVYASETPSGNLWSPFLDVSFFTLATVSHPKGYIPLAAHLKMDFKSFGYYTTCPGSLYEGTLFYNVSSANPNVPWFYTSFTSGVCQGNIGTPGSGGIGDVIMGFLKTVVLQIFPSAKDAYLQSVSNPWYEDDAGAFTADITIAVKLF